jgi:hypothetical protein
MLLRLFAAIAVAVLGTVVRASTIGAEVKTGACLFRFEDNGFLNIYPAQLRVDGKNLGEILGGSYRCIELTPGPHVAEVLSANPYDRNSIDSNAWRSKTLHFVLVADTKAFLKIWPGTRSGTYVGPWHLKISDKMPEPQMFPQSSR